MARYRRYKNGNSELNPYQIFALISFSLRAYLCYLTIDNIPIISNPLANELFLEVFSLYTFLWAISRITTSFFYQKGIDSPYTGSAIYFAVYIIYLLILFAVLSMLTFLKLLPL